MLRQERRVEKGPERTEVRPNKVKDRTPPPRRKQFDWRAGRQTIHLGKRTCLIAILDVSPDGVEEGRFQDPDRAFIQAQELIEAGAGMIEVCGASPSGGKAPVSAGEEVRRVVPILKRLRGNLDVPLAVETMNAAVAEKAVEYGATILHDPSGLIVEPALAKIAAQADLGLILSHMRGDPMTWPKISPMKDVNKGVASDLNASLGRAIRDGVERKRLVVDAGLGQGKRKEQDLQLLAYTGDFGRLEIPFSFGLSKHMAILGDPATLAAAVCSAVLSGAHVIRTHDFATARAAAALADSLLGA